MNKQDTLHDRMKQVQCFRTSEDGLPSGADLSASIVYR